MNLYFLDSNNNKRLVKKEVCAKEVGSVITQFVNNINPTYKIYYMRSWYNEAENGTMYDVGSHSEFFLLVDED